MLKLSTRLKYAAYTLMKSASTETRMKTAHRNLFGKELVLTKRAAPTPEDEEVPVKPSGAMVRVPGGLSYPVYGPPLSAEDAKETDETETYALLDRRNIVRGITPIKMRQYGLDESFNNQFLDEVDHYNLISLAAYVKTHPAGSSSEREEMAALKGLNPYCKHLVSLGAPATAIQALLAEKKLISTIEVNHKLSPLILSTMRQAHLADDLLDDIIALFRFKYMTYVPHPDNPSAKTIGILANLDKTIEGNQGAKYLRKLIASLVYDFRRGVAILAPKGVEDNSRTRENPTMVAKSVRDVLLQFREYVAGLIHNPIEVTEKDARGKTVTALKTLVENSRTKILLDADKDSLSPISLHTLNKMGYDDTSGYFLTKVNNIFSDFGAFKRSNPVLADKFLATVAQHVGGGEESPVSVSLNDADKILTLSRRIEASEYNPTNINIDQNIDAQRLMHEIQHFMKFLVDREVLNADQKISINELWELERQHKKPKSHGIFTNNTSNEKNKEVIRTLSSFFKGVHGTFSYEDIAGTHETDGVLKTLEKVRKLPSSKSVSLDSYADTSRDTARSQELSYDMADQIIDKQDYGRLYKAVISYLNRIDLKVRKGSDLALYRYIAIQYFELIQTNDKRFAMDNQEKQMKPKAYTDFVEKLYELIDKFPPEKQGELLEDPNFVFSLMSGDTSQSTYLHILNHAAQYVYQRNPEDFEDMPEGVKEKVEKGKYLSADDQKGMLLRVRKAFVLALNATGFTGFRDESYVNVDEDRPSGYTVKEVLVLPKKFYRRLADFIQNPSNLSFSGSTPMFTKGEITKLLSDKESEVKTTAERAKAMLAVLGDFPTENDDEEEMIKKMKGKIKPIQSTSMKGYDPSLVPSYEDFVEDGGYVSQDYDNLNEDD